MHILTFHSQSSFITATVDFILFLKPQTIALSGGSTPGPVYKTLGKGITAANAGQGNSALPNFYQVDERYVPRTSPDSNYKLITDCGLKLTHFFDTSLPIEKALTKYSTELPKKLDLIILGIGEDGHIASIFPCQSSDTPSRDGDKTSNLSKKVPSSPLSTNLKTAHTFAPKTSPVKDRLTLTLPYILQAKNILVLLKNKPKILKKLSTKSSPRFTKNQIACFPALALLKHKNLTIHYNP